jgi:hypothetical protein
MIEAKDAVVWVHDESNEVMVKPAACSRGPCNLRGWSDPIGAAYMQWQQMTDQQRVHLMLETAIDLTMQGGSMQQILIAFAEVRQFRALGAASYPMCRALTKALIGRSLEANTMGFEELLQHYARREDDAA